MTLLFGIVLIPGTQDFKSPVTSLLIQQEIRLGLSSNKLKGSTKKEDPRKHYPWAQIGCL